jgi:hypothetical protein
MKMFDHGKQQSKKKKFIISEHYDLRADLIVGGCVRSQQVLGFYEYDRVDQCCEQKSWCKQGCSCTFKLC